MTDEEKKKMKDLEDALKAAEKKAEDEAKARDKAEKAIADKDAIIEQKNKDIVGARAETTRLKALSDAEKQAMSEAEIKIHNATLKLQEEQEAFQKRQDDMATNERKSRLQAAIKNVSGRDADFAKKVEANIPKIVDHDKAMTIEDIEALVNNAANMTGTPRPSTVKAAISDDSGAVEMNEDGTKKETFDATPVGQDLMSRMGLPTKDPVAPAPKAAEGAK